MESVHVCYMYNGQTSCLGTIALNCWTSRISEVSVARLKEFYCIL